jgi:ribosomal protein S18 acetylase RimI-like enzyme
MSYVPATDESECYLKFLISSPNHRGQQIGHRLIELAADKGILPDNS